MTRRDFIKRLAKGTLATAALLHVPYSTIINLVPERSLGLKEEIALQALRRAFNNYCQATGKVPERILAGGKLFDQVESEMESIQQTKYGYPFLFGGGDYLYFKGVRLYRHLDAPPWSAYFYGGQE